tara:strand:- start:492 stop:665 length:174 start_codon:yes stop_codon:yes gene_type:complete
MIRSVEKQYSNNQFVSYELIYENNNIMSVPLDPTNSEYQAIQEWIADGGTVIDNPPE